MIEQFRIRQFKIKYKFSEMLLKDNFTETSVIYVIVSNMLANVKLSKNTHLSGNRTELPEAGRTRLVSQNARQRYSQDIPNPLLHHWPTILGTYSHEQVRHIYQCLKIFLTNQ